MEQKNLSVDLERLFTSESSLQEEKYPTKDYPRVSIIIPTCNCASLISLTLERLLLQEYSDFEIIIVDCSEDRTLEIINNFRSEKIRTYSASYSARYEMLNKGISHATGVYINVLFPGDFYISSDALTWMMTLALDHNKPQLVYCGTLLRDPKENTKILNRPFSLELLKKGQQPTSLQSCWFRLDALRELRKFSPNFHLRGGFDLMCRFALHPDFRAISTTRVLTDYELRIVTRKTVAIHFWETFKIVYKHFGFFTLLKWLFRQRDISRLLRLWMRNLRVAFAGHH